MTLTVQRDGDTKTITVTLGTRPTSPAQFESLTSLPRTERALPEALCHNAFVPRRRKDGANPVELHVVSGSTGETAARLVPALEAQSSPSCSPRPGHPRVESVEDLSRAVARAKGRPAVIVYTLVKPEWRDAMRLLCRRARVHYCDLLGHPIDSVRRVSGVAARMTSGARAALDENYFKRSMEAIEFAAGEGRRRRRTRAGRGGRHPRRCVAHSG